MIIMRHSDRQLAVRNIFDRLLKLCDQKGSAYTPDDDAFGNFNLVEHITNGRLSAESSILSRLCDKLGRIGNLLCTEIGNGAAFESIIDNCDDIIVYAALLRIALEQRQGNKNKDKERRQDGGQIDPTRFSRTRGDG